MHRLALFSALLLVVAGCGNPQEAALSKAPDIPTWPGLAELKKEELLKPILMGAARGNIAAVKEQALKPEFQDAFAKFEAEKMPSKYSTPEREAAHADVIMHFKALIEGAKSGASDEDLKASALAGNKALETLSQPAAGAAAPAK